jgi:hypothetical protein
MLWLFLLKNGFNMKPGLNFVSVWFGALMILLVTAGAIAFAFTDFMEDRLYGNKRTLFIFLLLSYAIYRSYRLYFLFKRPGREEE